VLKWTAHISDTISLSKPKHRQIQPLAANKGVDLNAVERAWEPKAPPVLLKGLAALVINQTAIWGALDDAIGEGARSKCSASKISQTATWPAVSYGQGTQKPNQTKPAIPANSF
jgi:hypothetical protein